MSKTLKTSHLETLLSEIKFLYSKYRLLCSIDCFKIESKNISDVDLYLTYAHIFKTLESDFEDIFHEIESLGLYSSDE